MRPFLLLLLVCCALGLIAQAPVGGIIADPPEGPLPWTRLNFNNDPARFQFAIVTDRTGGHRPGVFLEGVKRLNLIQPEFVMSVGDLIEGYTTDTVELLRQWEEFDGFVDQLEMPFFYLPGNHDITNKVMEDLWHKRYGPTYYAFTYRDILFLCVNSEDQYRGSGRGSISDEQYEWIKETLEAHTDVRWTLLFMHQPLWVQDTDPLRWAEVEELLRDRPHTVFAGHRHRYVKYDRNNGKYIMLATTGGGSRLRGPELGEFDHVVWVTMTEEGPLLANIELAGVWNEDVVTEQTRSFIDLVESRNPIQIEPLFLDDGFEGGSLQWRITNDADHPMAVELDDNFSWDLHASLDRASLEVPPNSVEFVNLELRPRHTENAAGPWQPVSVQGHFAYTGEGVPNIEFPFQYLVAPETKYELTWLEGPVDVDGDLADWHNLPIRLTDPSVSPEDNAVDFALAYDEDNLYLAARVLDDDLRADTSESLFQQDYLRLVLNAEPVRKSAMRTGQGNFSASAQLLANPGGDRGRFYYENRMPEGASWACRPTDKGYVLELAIPMDYLQQKQGYSWETVRFNLMVQDSDSGEAEPLRLFFQPPWNGNENRIGSGTFFRKKGQMGR